MPLVDPTPTPPALQNEVLQSLSVHRRLSTTQVHFLHAPNASRRWVQKVLAGLERDGLVAFHEGAPRLP